jgi:HEAT repeat protein
MGNFEEMRSAKEIVQAFLKAKKTVRMYPDNNPIYLRTVDDVFQKFQDFFGSRDELGLRIKQNEIFLDSEQIYHNTEKEDNLALFFFKDGIRELTFKKDLSRQEMEEFLKIIALDFDREAVDDDIVTLLWERDFQGIKYVVDEAFLLEDDAYEAEAVREAKDKSPKADELLKAYADAFRAEDVTEISIVNLSDKDLQVLVREIEKDQEEKTGKLSEILFEMLFQAESTDEFHDICRFFSDVIVYALGHGDLKTAVGIMKRAGEIMQSPASSEAAKGEMGVLSATVSSPELVRIVGEILDAAMPVDEELLKEYVSFLDKNAIAPFIAILGDMKNIHGRKQVINILVTLGRKDLPALAKGLHDSRWYLVRNIIYVLRLIGDKKAVEYLLGTARHSDVRVRKESIKALGELKSPLSLQTLKDALDDEDSSVRRLAAKSLGSSGSETAKRMLIEKISGKDFRSREFEEKKEFFEALTHWNSPDIADFMVQTLKKRSFFRRSSLDENRACAAYCLGLMHSKDALPVLSKLRDSGNPLLKEYATTAVRRIEHGG